MNLREKADRELVSLLVNNDESAFTELYVRYKNKLLAFCFTYLKSISEAVRFKQSHSIRNFPSNT